MEVPVAANGSLLVPLDYLRFVCEEANARLAENFTRIMKFEHRLRETSFIRHDSSEMNTLRCSRHPVSLCVSDGNDARETEKNCQEDAEFFDFVDSLFPED
jgi:hypothetical protein